MSQTKSLTSGSIVKALIMISLPLLGSSFIQHLYSTIDIIFIGHFDGTLAQSAIGSTTQIIILILAFFSGFSSGISVLVSHAFGSGDFKHMSKIIHTAVSSSAIFSVILATVGFFVSSPILSLLQTPAEIFPLSTSYLQIYFFSVPFVLMYDVLASICYASGNTKTPLIFAVIGGLMNVLMDYIFVGIFTFGVYGVAYASLFSEGICTVGLLIYMLLTKKPYKVTIKKLSLNLSIIKNILKIGLPSAFQYSMVILSNILIQGFINTLGSYTISAFTVYYRIEDIVYLPMMSMGQAICAFTGQNFGANKMDRVKKGTWIAQIISWSVVVILTAPLLIFSHYICAFFNPDIEVIKIVQVLLYIIAPCYMIYSVIEIFSGSIRGMGKTTRLMIMCISALCLFRVALMLVFMPLFSSHITIAIIYPCTWILYDILLLSYFIFGRWNKAKSSMLS